MNLSNKPKYIKYMELAKFFSSWSKDPSTQVGAVIIGESGQVISQGYNGLPRGVKDEEHILNNRELKYQYVVHAEQNTLYNALLNGTKITPESTMYVYGMPVCSECAKGIIQSGVKNVVYYLPEESKTKDGYPKWLEMNKLTEKLFKEAKVNYKKIGY